MCGTRFFILFSLCLLAALHFANAACEAPSDTNFAESPQYWCSVETRISVSSTCTIDVDETIVLPWSIGVVDRFLPVQEHQNIESLLAFQQTDGKNTSIEVNTQDDSPDGNVLIRLRPSSSNEPTTVVIRYKVNPGVLGFVSCSEVTEFKEISSARNNDLMISRWALGGRSVSRVQQITVRFYLALDADLQYVDTATTGPVTFLKPSKEIQAGSEAPFEVFYEGDSSSIDPSRLNFYIRYKVLFGQKKCVRKRNCVNEHWLLREGSLGPRDKIIAGGVLGAVMLILVVFVAFWMWYCKIMRQRQADEENNPDLPESIQHFAFDTGDDSFGDGENGSSWTTSAPGSPGAKSKTPVEEVYALDLSPRPRLEKNQFTSNV